MFDDEVADGFDLLGREVGLRLGGARPGVLAPLDVEREVLDARLVGQGEEVEATDVLDAKIDERYGPPFKEVEGFLGGADSFALGGLLFSYSHGVT